MTSFCAHSIFIGMVGVRRPGKDDVIEMKDDLKDAGTAIFVLGIA